MVLIAWLSPEKIVILGESNGNWEKGLLNEKI